MGKVIINADDFGMSQGYNCGLIKAYKDGIVSSTTIMINMAAAEHAISLAKDYPELFIGLHVNFVLGKCCADHNLIPSMVDENGEFYRSGEYRSGKRTFLYKEAKIETIAQMEKFKELTGQYPEHIEGHATGNEEVERAFLDIAKEFKIHCSLVYLTENELDGYIKTKSIPMSDYAKLFSKGVEVESFINNDFGILDVKDEEVLELHFHPGYIDQYVLDNSSLTFPRCKDLQTLCDPRLKEFIKVNNLELVNFRNLKC